MNENGLFLRPTFFPNSTPLTRLCAFAKTDWKQGEEDELWASKAIESLVKRMKKENNGGLENLERALMYPDQPSECATIERSLDGRLQVNHKKGLPHVIYCRIWRWPDLQAHQELDSLPFCQNPYSSKQTNICVNPYHYARVEANMLPAVLVPRNMYNDPPPRKRNRFLKMLSSQMYKLVGRNGNVGDSPSPGYSPSSVGSQAQPSSPYSCMSDEDQMQIDDCGHNQARMISPCSDHHMEVDMTSMPIRNVPNFNEHFNQLPDVWCAISYYEMNSRVGETYEVNPHQLSVIVDGFTDPTSRRGRFCLGLLSNINRGPNIQQARDNIGNGIKITYDIEEYGSKLGDVYIKCLSEYAVFVQSLNCNHFRGFHKNTICKIPPGKELKIFDAKSFLQLLEEARQNIQLLEEARQNISQWVERCLELHKMALVYLSFARGWGAEYKHQNITSTPCWIEIRLNQPLKLYDFFLGSKLHGNPMSSIT